MPNRDGHWDEDPEYDFDPDVEDYEVYDEEEGRRRVPLMLLSVVALLVVFAGVVFLAYRQGDTDGGMPPLLRADGEPTKDVPANPGGKTFPHQDAGIYDRIGGEAAAGRGESEQLLPPAEEPLAIDRSSEISPRDQQAMDRLAQAIESAPLEPIAPGTSPAEPEAVVPSAPATPADQAPVSASRASITGCAAVISKNLRPTGFAGNSKCKGRAASSGRDECFRGDLWMRGARAR